MKKQILTLTLLTALALLQSYDAFAQQLRVRTNDTISNHTMIEPITSNSNIFIGANAGRKNVAFGNTVIGNNAGFSLTTGTQNIFIGPNAGNKVRTANFNTIIGSFAGPVNTTGAENTFLGQAAGNLNVGGSQNTFLGRNAGAKNTFGVANTFVGTSSGSNSATGIFNTALGFGAGNGNTNGNSNVFLGYFAGALENDNNKLYIHNNVSNRDIALIYGEFDSQKVQFNATEVLVKNGTTPTIKLESDGTNEESGRVSMRQSNGSGADVFYDGTNTEDVFAIETFSSGNSLGRKFTMDLNGNVGIGITSDIASGHKLSVAGYIAAEEVRVQLQADWPDYVFAPEYELMPLDDLKHSIEKNSHLPNIPSAQEVEVQGIQIGDMQTRMMEKIEELTLYILELHEEIKVLKRKN